MGKSKRNDKKHSNKNKQILKDFGVCTTLPHHLLSNPSIRTQKKKRKKLGVKLKPANATEIKFRSHSIHVTKQSLKDQNRESRKTVAFVSVDITEALVHLSHHSAKVRRDVLIELKSILSRIDDDPKTFRSVLHQNLVHIVTIFEFVYDHESIVRGALKTFINWFMPRCKAHIELFGPFWSGILAHLSAALSHINMKIRYNALKILRSFFSVSSVAKYFDSKWCLLLLSHLQLLFYDIVRSGHFILNDDDIKMITSLNRRGTVTQNSNTQKTKKTLSNNEETVVIVHILCECATHIIRVIQQQMHDSHDTIENSLHSLLLPSDNKMHSLFVGDNDGEQMEVDEEDNDLDLNVMQNDNMQLLKSLLSIFTSCALIFEQFGKKQKYSAMSMVLTLCGIITDCLCDDTLKQMMSDYMQYQTKQIEKRKKAKNKGKYQRFRLNDLRLFISKSLMSLFKVFPIEYVQRTEDENEGEEEDKMKENEAKSVMDRVFVIRINMKTIDICHRFVDYWNLNLLQVEDGGNKRMDYYKHSYKWLHDSLMDLASSESQSVSVNKKIMIDLLQILKKMIGLFDEEKQLQLLLCVDKLVNNEALISDAQTLFRQFVN